MNRINVTATMALAGCLLFNTGCSHFILRPDDSVGVKAGKAMSRLVFGVATFGATEFAMAEAKREDARKQRRHALYVDLDNNIGLMTIDAAVSRWGPPASQYDGDRILVAEWTAETSSRIVVPVGNAWIARDINRGWELQLSFDKATRTLSDWKYREW